VLREVRGGKEVGDGATVADDGDEALRIRTGLTNNKQNKGKEDENTSNRSSYG
jgi:hypothetical protein